MKAFASCIFVLAAMTALCLCLPSPADAGLFWNRDTSGCPSCANGQCPNGQCPNCPAAPAIVSTPIPKIPALPKVDACGDVVPPKTTDVTSTEAALVAAINAQRARYGLPALEIDTHVHLFARMHAAWMARFGCMRHSGGCYAENIAMGQPSVESVVQTWMNSPGHRANILNGGYRTIGVGCAADSAGRLYWCQNFSTVSYRLRERETVALAPAPPVPATCAPAACSPAANCCRTQWRLTRRHILPWRR
jgi:hypothetical protein